MRGLLWPPQTNPVGQRTAMHVQPEGEHEQGQRHRYDPEDPEAGGDIEGLGNDTGRAGGCVEIEELRAEYCLSCNQIHIDQLRRASQ